jgi:hypothetical protein
VPGAAEGDELFGYLAANPLPFVLAQTAEYHRDCAGGAVEELPVVVGSCEPEAERNPSIAGSAKPASVKRRRRRSRSASVRIPGAPASGGGM